MTVVSAIVVAFGKERLLNSCLRALESALARLEAPSELIIVLNEVSAESLHELREQHPHALFVPTKRNLGFAGGVTAGLAAASGSWIALVNDDCVLDDGCLVELLRAGRQRDDLGSIAAQVRFASRSDTINSAGLEIDTRGVATERLVGLRASSHSDEDETEVFGASATVALYRRRMLDDVGGFDETFFAYLEDADLAWRARMKGWRCVHTPRAVAFHHHSASLGHGSDWKFFLVGRNRVRMLAKNATRRQLVRHGPAIVLYDCGYVAFALLRRHTLAPLRGRLHGIREWRSYRTAGTPDRRFVSLARPAGVRAALRRNRAYGG